MIIPLRTGVFLLETALLPSRVQPTAHKPKPMAPSTHLVREPLLFDWYTMLTGPITAQKARELLLDGNVIITDLTTEKPEWMLSAYGPGRKVPCQLFGGVMREQSPEEIRLLHYEAIASGNPQKAVRFAPRTKFAAAETDKVEHFELLLQGAEQQNEGVLDDINGAINYIIEGLDEVPNRITIVEESAPRPMTGLFARPSTPPPAAQDSQSPFGAPGQPANAFGAPSGAFGQPSAMGQQKSAFGQPAQQPSAFGAPSQLGASGAFGQPSALGQKPSAFGAPNQPAAFGQTVALGQKPNAFGAPPQPLTAGPFGQPSGRGKNTNPFGAPQQPAAASPFSQPSALGQKTSPFGAPPKPAAASPFGQPAQSSNPFGPKPQINSNPFGAPPRPATSNPFGSQIAPAQASPFGQTPKPTPAATNPFGGGSAVPTPTNAAQNLFGSSKPQVPQQSPFGAPQQPKANPFGSPQAAAGKPQRPPVNTFDNSQSGPGNPHPLHPRPQATLNSKEGGLPYASNAKLQHPPLHSYCIKNGDQLTTFQNKQVRYKDNSPGTIGRDGKWEKIWNPEGAPPYYADTEMEGDVYDDDDTKKEKAEERFLHMRETGVFKAARTREDGFYEGDLPLVAPKREWCTWDF